MQDDCWSGVVMRLDKIDLNLFVVFDALYRERSVTKVARQLNLTQPAVSNALSRLRQTFDDQLFVRTKEGMAPTPVADSVVADVRKALALLSRSVEMNARFDAAKAEKKFRLAMNELAEILLLPGLREMTREEAPGISFSSYYIDRVSAGESLRSGGVDLLIDSAEVNARDFGHQTLLSLPYVVAMSHQHPLAQKRLTLKGYLEAEHIHVSSRLKGRGQMDVALHAMGYNRRVVMRVRSYLVAARIVEQTDLLWTVPKILAETLPLKLAKLPFAMDNLNWNLYWHRQAESDPANQWLREKIMKIAGS